MARALRIFPKRLPKRPKRLVPGRSGLILSYGSHMCTPKKNRGGPPLLPLLLLSFLNFREETRTKSPRAARLVHLQKGTHV